MHFCLTTYKYTKFDNFEWLKSCDVIKEGKLPQKKTLFNSPIGVSFTIPDDYIVQLFYMRYIRPFSFEFATDKSKELLSGNEKLWALFCIERAPLMIQMLNDYFDEEFERICNELGLSYTLLNDVFDAHKPFATNYDCYKFAYDNIDSENLHYFYILLIMSIEGDYPTDMKELLDFQKDLTESFVRLAPHSIKEKAIVALYKAFEQINKTKIFKDKLGLSYDKILYGEGIPLTGSFYLRWDKVSFYDGFYLIEHPSVSRYAKKSKPLKIADSHSKKVFNDISRIFLKRLPPLHLQAVKGKIVKVYNRACLDDCVSIMEYKVNSPAKVRKNLKERPKIKKKEISSSEASKLCKEFKSRFLDYLCKKQLDEYKVICCVENRVNSDLAVTTEYSFIFTIKESKDLVYIAFENTSDSRCTYVFPIPRRSWKESIDALYAFFASSEVNKRQALSQRLVNLQLPGRYDYIRVLHTDYLKWVDRIRCCF